MRKKFYLCALLLTIPHYAHALDLSGFYRCSGTKTVLSAKIGAPVSLPRVTMVTPSINPNGNAAPINPNSAPVPAPTNDPNTANPAPTANTMTTTPTKIKINPPATAGGGFPQSPPPASEASAQNDTPVLSSGADDNAAPVAALLNLRTIEGGENTYVFQQMNDDGSILWGLFYYDNNRLFGGFNSRTKQLKEYQGAASLNVSPEDGTFSGQFYIENIMKGNVSCSKL